MAGVEIMIDEKRVALENLLLDIDFLNELNPWIDNINIFEILKMSKMEIRHSNFLAWLLNPNENHSFGERILKDVICHIIKHNRESMDKAFNIIDATLWKYDSFNVYREKDNIDILAISSSLKVLVCIENKIFSSEHTEQTIRYRRKIDEIYPEYGKLFIYLTPSGAEAIDYENWVSLPYRELIQIIETNMALKNLEITAKERAFVEDYVSGVKRHMVDDSNLQEICSRIYFKHKQALDLIFDNKPDLRDLLYAALFERFEDEAIIGNIDIDRSCVSKQYIRFNTPYSLKLFPKMTESRKSVWNTDFMFYYQIENRKGVELRIFATLSNRGRNSLFEDELEMCAKVYNISEKKTIGEKWQWRTLPFYKRHQISDKDFDEMSAEEFNSDKEAIVDDIFANIMKAVKSFEDKLQKHGL